MVKPKDVHNLIGAPAPMPGSIMKAWRNSLGWSQSDMAQFLGLKAMTGRHTIRRWETGVHEIPYSVSVTVHIASIKVNKQKGN